MSKLLRLIPDDVKAGLVRQVAKPVLDAAWNVMPRPMKKIAEKPAVKKIMNSPEFNAVVDIAASAVVAKAVQRMTTPKAK